MNSSDRTQDLLRRAQEDDPRAWEEIYRRYRTYLILLARTRIQGYGRGFDAEDVLQSAFLSVWDGIRSFHYEGEGSFRRWLARIVLNKLRDRLRRQEGVRGTLEAGSGRDLDAVADPQVQPPSEEIRRAELEGRLLESLQGMDEADQELIVMRMFEKLTWGQIAEIHDRPVGAVRRHFERAMVKLQHRMA